MADPHVVEVDVRGIAVPIRLGVGLMDIEEIGTVEIGDPGEFQAGLADLLEAVARLIRKGL